MRSLFAALALLAAVPAHAFTTLPESSADFAQARECRPLKDGRRVWVGHDAYYVQAWLFYTGESGQIDDDAVSVVSPADNSKDALAPFADACK